MVLTQPKLKLVKTRKASINWASGFERLCNIHYVEILSVCARSLHSNAWPSFWKDALPFAEHRQGLVPIKSLGLGSAGYSN